MWPFKKKELPERVITYGPDDRDELTHYERVIVDDVVSGILNGKSVLSAYKDLYAIPQVIDVDISTQWYTIVKIKTEHSVFVISHSSWNKHHHFEIGKIK